MRKVNIASLSLLVACTIAACGGGEPASTPAANAPAPTAPSAPVSLDKNAYPVFPDADAGADPTVSAELGGRGFTGEGWETNTDYDLIGDPRAVKGGAFRDAHDGIPRHAADRGAGVEHDPQLHDRRNGLRVAAHDSPDDARLHPRARDALASLRGRRHVSVSHRPERALGRRPTGHRGRRGRELVLPHGQRPPDPRARSSSSASSRSPSRRASYIVSVKSQVRNWRNFLYFSGSMWIFPAHVLKDVDGAKYLKDYNFKLLPGTGPYRVDEADVDKGNGLTIRRRDDYWAAKRAAQRRPLQLRRGPRDRRPRPEPHVRNVQEGRSRQLLRQHLARVGRGAELRPRAARPDPEAQDLQRRPQRRRGPRVQHAQAAVRRHPRAQGAHACSRTASS